MNEEGNNTGFFSPLFSGNKNNQSMQPFSTVSSTVEISEGRDNVAFNTRSSSPISMYSNNRQSFESYVENENERDYDDKYKYNSNSTYVNEEGIIQPTSTTITTEQDLYHSSSLRSNDNIYSVEFSPTNNYFNNNNNQAQSTSVFTTNAPIMSDDANNIFYSNINNYNPPATPSTVFSVNDGNDNSGMDKTYNIDIISSRPESNIRSYSDGNGFWKNLWKMDFFNNKKPTLKFWLALILIIVLLLLIVIPAVVVSSNKSSTSSSDDSSSTSSTISTSTGVSSAPSLTAPTAPITTGSTTPPTIPADTTSPTVPAASTPTSASTPPASPDTSASTPPTSPAATNTSVTPSIPVDIPSSIPSGATDTSALTPPANTPVVSSSSPTTSAPVK